MYEDLWPNMGDYDFNDLVINYQIAHTLNNRNKLIELQYSFQIQAIGASFHNGFSLHLPGVLASNIASSTLVKDNVLIKTNLVDPQNSEANLILLANASDHIVTGCGKYRTLENCHEDITSTFVATIVFTEPVDIVSLGSPPYDPYIFAIDGQYHGVFSGRGWEVHLKEFSGSDLFDFNLLGLIDDNSNINNNFINKNNFPWAINLSEPWDHPSEGTDILNAYPDFSTWVQSSGQQKREWYKKQNANIGSLY